MMGRLCSTFEAADENEITWVWSVQEQRKPYIPFEVFCHPVQGPSLSHIGKMVQPERREYPHCHLEIKQKAGEGERDLGCL